MINLNEIFDNIYDSTTSAFTDGYDTEKILLTQAVYDAFKQENERAFGLGNGEFDHLIAYPVEINNEVDQYMVVVKKMKS